MSSKRLQAASKSSTETQVWPTEVERVSTDHVLGLGQKQETYILVARRYHCGT
jgi:hypothetical protein